ncbi:MAG: hypothetical protein V3T19_00365 [Acidiferrobacterales bacterium]
MKRLDLLHLIMLVIVLILGFYLWFTPYQYKGYAELVVRINRFTGAADLLNLDGWERMEPAAPKKGTTLLERLEEPKRK